MTESFYEQDAHWSGTEATGTSRSDGPRGPSGILLNPAGELPQVRLDLVER